MPPKPRFDFKERSAQAVDQLNFSVRLWRLSRLVGRQTCASLETPLIQLTCEADGFTAQLKSAYTARGIILSGLVRVHNFSGGDRKREVWAHEAGDYGEACSHYKLPASGQLPQQLEPSTLEVIEVISHELRQVEAPANSPR